MIRLRPYKDCDAEYCYKSIGFKTYAAYTACFPYGNEKWGCYYMDVNR